MCEFTVDGFMKNMNLTNKHPEIFHSGKDKLIKTFIDYFIKYTKIINSDKKGSIEKLIKNIKSDFKIPDDSADQLQLNSWNSEYFKYCVKKKDNDIYVFPRNVGGKKITLNQQYFVNCIKLENVKIESLIIVNRNNHMMISGESKNDEKELGKELHFKILIIYNNELKKWLVVPYKMVSRPTDDVRCDSFALSATTDNTMRQYKVWNQGIDRYSTKLGVLNYKYLDNKYKALPNLFDAERSDQLIEKAQTLIYNLIPDKKQSVKMAGNKKSKTKSKKGGVMKGSKTKSKKDGVMKGSKKKSKKGGVIKGSKKKSKKGGVIKGSKKKSKKGVV
jgi:hypothetical protein